MDLRQQRQRAAGGGQVAHPGLAGRIQRPDQAEAASSQPIGLPGRRRLMAEHGEAEVQRGGQRALGEHGQGQGPDQGDRQAGGQAAEGGREQQPGEHGPGPRRGHGLVLGSG